jgi:hypothetical protein
MDTYPQITQRSEAATKLSLRRQMRYWLREALSLAPWL